MLDLVVDFLASSLLVFETSLSGFGTDEDIFLVLDI